MCEGSKAEESQDTCFAEEGIRPLSLSWAECREQALCCKRAGVLGMLVRRGKRRGKRIFEDCSSPFGRILCEGGKSRRVPWYVLCRRRDKTAQLVILARGRRVGTRRFVANMRASSACWMR